MTIFPTDGEEYMLRKAFYMIDSVKDLTCDKTSFYIQIIDEMLATIEAIKQFSADRDRGTALFSANIGIPIVETKFEYMLYIDLFGFPPLGQFNETALAKIRKDYAKYYR